MRCSNCGQDFGPPYEACPRCRQPADKVTVLTKAERDDFQGVTLEDEASEKSYYQYESSGSNHRVYVRQINFGAGKIGLLTKLLIMLALAFLVFVFLPVAVFVVLTLGLIWFVFRLLRR